MIKLNFAVTTLRVTDKSPLSKYSVEFMNLEKRINLLVELGNYTTAADPAWLAVQQRAFQENGWFYPEFIELAIRQIASSFLQKDQLTQWARQYQIPSENTAPKQVGLIMAGNIPLVGFHDFLSVFLSGHRQVIKPSSRDEVLIRHLVQQLIILAPEAAGFVSFAERLNGMDAYIATGSNNSARYFDYYFGKYPHIIRRNRTSVAVLTGQESPQELEKLADDVYQYFGLGCRNVTQLYVPENYDFAPLLEVFGKYNYLADHAKYKHNYDYQLTLLLLNKKYYMTNGSILLAENPSPFSPISVLNYVYYRPGQAPQPPSPPAHAIPGQNGLPIPAAPLPDLSGHPDIQCVVGQAYTPFGQAQRPSLTDYADGVDTLQFLRDL